MQTSWRIRVVRAAVLLATGAAAHPAADPVFRYGAVYFRKSNPPEADWARDHATAARIGMNTFRHWFMWSAIEVAPGKYDWRDYDRMMVGSVPDHEAPTFLLASPKRKSRFQR
jgi:hypothetical protein